MAYAIAEKSKCSHASRLSQVLSFFMRTVYCCSHTYIGPLLALSHFLKREDGGYLGTCSFAQRSLLAR